MNSPTTSDKEMVDRALRNPEAFGPIIERYEAPLRRYVRRLGVKLAEDQEDVLQEIFIKVYRNLNSFDTTLKFSSWLYRIAHNEAISWFRKQNVRPEGHLIGDSEEVISFIKTSGQDQEQIFDETINAEVLTEAIQKIEEKYRVVLILRYFEHKEYEEISDILKIPTGSVGTLLHRGKKQLKRFLNPSQINV